MSRAFDLSDVEFVAPAPRRAAVPPPVPVRALVRRTAPRTPVS